MSAEQRPQEFQFDLSGGHLALDFANSVSRRDSPQRTVEHLRNYRDLVAFARQTGILSQDQAEGLEWRAFTNSRAGLRALRTAVGLREAIYRVFHALANGKPASAPDVRRIDKAVHAVLHRRHIAGEDGSYRWQWDANLDLQRVIWPVIESAAQLLTSPEVKRVRQCQASDCYWLFLDTSRNHSRRWCSMEACGNREKARRHYHRQRST